MSALPNQPNRQPYIQAGFTLIEMMIVVVIIAILAAIAVPSYMRYVTRTNRTAGEACLSQYASYMERYYTSNLRYDKDTTSTANPALGAAPTYKLDCAGSSQTGNNYTYATTATATSYTLTATPIGAQLARDTQCGSLTLDQTGTRGPTTAGCWQ